MIQKVNGKRMFTKEFYDFGKKVVQVYLPALSTLYFSLGNIWGFPHVPEVVGSCAIVATFFGVCLGLSSKSFDASGAGYFGEITTHESPKGKKLYSLDIKGDPEEIDNRDSVTFKVAK